MKGLNMEYYQVVYIYMMEMIRKGVMMVIGKGVGGEVLEGELYIL